MKTPKLYHRISVKDIELFAQVSYGTARKQYQQMLKFYGKPIRYINFKEMLQFYNPELDSDAEMNVVLKSVYEG